MEAEGWIRFLESQPLHCDDHVRPEPADVLSQNSVTEHVVDDKMLVVPAAAMLTSSVTTTST